MGISLGIVGIGSFGRAFVSLFRDHPLVDRIALCDVQADRLSAAAKEFRIAETYASLDEICKSDIQALAIITQPWLHAPQAVQAMRAGKHVYSAVPPIMLPDGDEMLDWCDKIIETCTQTGMKYMLGETSYYRPQAMYCRRRAAEGAFGEFVLAEGEYLHDLDHGLREVAMNRWGKDWDTSKSGHIPMHYPTHSIGGLLSVMNAHMTEVSAIGFALPDDDWFRRDNIYANVFSNETALFRVSNGAAARICEYRRVGHNGREGFQIFGTAGCFLDGAGESMWMTKDARQGLSVEEMRDPLPPEVLRAFGGGDAGVYGGHGGSHAYLVHEFVEAVAADRMPAVNAWQAARYLAPGVMAHKSALRDGELLKIPDWGDPPA